MIYSVTVKPNSKKGPLVIEAAEGLVVYLREKPVDGAANQALIRLLSQYFQVDRSLIRLKTGARGRKKLVEISGL